MNPAERFDTIRVVPAFFDHLPASGDEGGGIFCVHHSAGYFESAVADAVSKLPDEHDFASGRDRNDVHPVRRLEHVEIVLGFVA